MYIAIASDITSLTLRVMVSLLRQSNQCFPAFLWHIEAEIDWRTWCVRPLLLYWVVVLCPFFAPTRPTSLWHRHNLGASARRERPRLRCSGHLWLGLLQPPFPKYHQFGCPRRKTKCTIFAQVPGRSRYILTYETEHRLCVQAALLRLHMPVLDVNTHPCYSFNGD